MSSVFQSLHFNASKHRQGSDNSENLTPVHSIILLPWQQRARFFFPSSIFFNFFSGFEQKEKVKQTHADAMTRRSERVFENSRNEIQIWKNKERKKRKKGMHEEMIRFKDLNLFVSSESLFHSQREKFVPYKTESIEFCLLLFLLKIQEFSMKNIAFALLYMTSQSA